MMKAMLLAGAVCFGLASTALAQDMTSAERTACMGDYKKFCDGTQPGGGRIIACLDKHSVSLSAACKKVIADRKK